MNPLRQQWYPEDKNTTNQLLVEEANETRFAILQQEIEILMQRLARLENAFAQPKFLEAHK